jgi:hypothetical protein
MYVNIRNVMASCVSVSHVRGMRAMVCNLSSMHVAMARHVMERNVGQFI